GVAVAGRAVRRPPDGAVHPLPDHERAGAVLHHPHRDGAAGGAVQRTAPDDHRALSRRPRSWFRCKPEGQAMRQLILNRRRLLGLGAASASTLLLSGCDWYDGGLGMGDGLRSALERANALTYHAQRLLVGQQALATEYTDADILQGQRPNGTVDPQTPEYLAIKANNFAGYRLNITGLVNTPLSLSLAELKALPARTQITRHDCVEGW